MLWTVQVSLPLVFGVHFFRGIPADPDLIFWLTVAGLMLVTTPLLLANNSGAIGTAAVASLLLFGAIFVLPLDWRVYAGAFGLPPALLAGRHALRRLHAHLGD
jgi:hypothetical protein